MTKNKGKYLNAHASVTLVWAVFLFCVTAWPSVRALQGVERTASVRAIRSSAGSEIEQVKNWVLERYAALHFVYQVEVQLSELHSEEIERQRKSESDGGRGHLPSQSRFDSSPAGVLAFCLHSDSRPATSLP